MDILYPRVKESNSSEWWREPKIQSHIAKTAPKFLSKCLTDIEWWSWCWAGEIRIYSSHFQYRIPMWECLRFDPATLNKNIKTLTPRIVNKSTFFPKKKTKIEINKAWVKALLNEKTMPSKDEF